MAQVRIIGVHPLPVTEQMLKETLKCQYDTNLSDEERPEAEARVREHFAHLYLIEVELDQPDAEFDFGQITQRAPRLPKGNWQVPYDERRLDPEGKRWAFFFHFLDLSKPLLVGRMTLPVPDPTPIPPHLSEMLQKEPYEAP